MHQALSFYRVLSANSGPTERPNRSQQSISFELSMRALYTHFELNYGYRPRVSYKKIPEFMIFYVSLPEQHLPGRGGCTRIQYKLYANALCYGNGLQLVIV